MSVVIRLEVPIELHFAVISSRDLSKFIPQLLIGTPTGKPEATAIEDMQDGRWKITLSFDGRSFCVPKFRH